MARKRQYHVIVLEREATEATDPAYTDLARIPLSWGMAEAIGQAWTEINSEDLVMIAKEEDFCDCWTEVTENDGTPLHYQECFIVQRNLGYL